MARPNRSVLICDSRHVKRTTYNFNTRHQPSTRKSDGETAINDVPRVRQTETKLSPRFSLELVKGIPGDGAPVSKQVTPAWVLSLWYKPPQIGLSREQAILKDMLG